MIELARVGGRAGARATTSGCSSSRARSSARTTNPLPAVFAAAPVVDEAALVICLEPTDNTLQLGCLGNINARVVFEGKAAHSARPWLGVNAIALALEGLRPVLELEPLDVDVDGLIFREVLSVTQIDDGGNARQRHPGAGRGTLNFRYAPDTHARPRPRQRAARARRPRRRDPPATRPRRPSRSARRSSSGSATSAGSRSSRSRRGRTSPTSPRAGSTRSTSGPARRATRTRRRRAGRDRASSRGPTTRCSGSCSVASERAALAAPRRSSRSTRSPASTTGAPTRGGRGIDVIDFGVGDPREVDAGVHPRGARRPGSRRSPRTRGRPGSPSYRAAIAAWIARRFGVAVDPDGRDRADARLEGGDLLVRARSRSAERRLVAVPEPAYPVYERGALFAGAEVVTLPLREERRLASRSRRVRRAGTSSALFWTCYPNNPTGATAPLAFYEELAARAREHGFLLCSDEAYSELWFDEPPVSALQLERRENVVVFNTLSKRSSMTGYRCGLRLRGRRTSRTRCARSGRRRARRRRSSSSGRRSPRGRDEAHVEAVRGLYRRKRETLLPVLERQGAAARPAATRRSSSGWRSTAPPSRSPGGCSSTGSSSRRARSSAPPARGMSGWRSSRRSHDCERAAAILEEVL